MKDIIDFLTGGGGLLSARIDSIVWFLILCGMIFMGMRALYNRNKK